MDLKETDILGGDVAGHWYYRSKSKAMAHLLAGISFSRILDVGAGSGFFSRYLLRNSPANEAWCVDISYPADSEALEGAKRIYFRRAIDGISADLVLLMDVLEHVDDDVGLLREYVDKVPSGAVVLISVPAFRFLWSRHDVFLDHKRRYTLAQIERVALDAGLRVERGSYYFGAVFPIAAGIRLAQKVLGDRADAARSQLIRHSSIVNGTLSALSDVELAILNHNRVAGLTAFCVARKP